MSTQQRTTNYGLHLMQYPSMRWGFVGSIPMDLCKEKINSIGQKYFDSIVFDNQKDAETAAAEKGFNIISILPR